MNDETDPTEAHESAPTKKNPITSSLDKAADMADKAGGTLENAQGAFSAIKWIGISIVCLTILAVLWAGYKIFYKPAAMVGDAAGSVAEAVGDGAGAVKDSASSVINRLLIPSGNQKALNKLSEDAFTVLNNMAETKPEGLKDRMFRRTNFSDSEGRICKLTLNFGTGDIPAYAAADNKAHATSKSLGSTDDRLIRLVIRADKDDIPLNTLWDEEAKIWQMKWKKTTVKKPMSDEIAEERIVDMLSAISKQCGT